MSFEFVTLNLLGKWFDPNLYTNLLSTKKRLLFKMKTTLALDLKNESIRFSKKIVAIAGLNRAKLGVYQLQSFLFIVVIVISILLKTAIENYIWTNFNLWSITGETFIAMRQGKITFIEIKKYRHGLWKTTGISKHLNGMLEVVEITLILLIFEWLI